MQKLKLLLVDDEVNILKSYVRALRNEPYEISTANSAEEALKLVVADHFDVIISDFRMPGMNGVEFFRKVRQIDRSIIRVILSGYADESVVDQALVEQEVLKYLLKPITNDQLRDEVRNCFELSKNQKE